MTLSSTMVDLAAGEERYLCWSIAAGSDLAVVATRTDLPPVGIHHYAVFASDDDVPAAPGAYDCPSVGTAWGLLSGEGRGSPTLSFPPGVALPLRGGQHLILQLHLVNTSTAKVAVPAASVTLVTSPDDDLILAGALFASTSPAPLSPHGAAQVTSRCSSPEPLPNVFAAYASMTSLGRRVTLSVPGDDPDGDVVLVSRDESDRDEVVHPARVTTRGSKVELSCAFTNPTDSVASAENCRGVVFYYPATAARSLCAPE